MNRLISVMRISSWKGHGKDVIIFHDCGLGSKEK